MDRFTQEITVTLTPFMREVLAQMTPEEVEEELVPSKSPCMLDAWQQVDASWGFEPGQREEQLKQVYFIMTGENHTAP